MFRRLCAAGVVLGILSASTLSGQDPAKPAARDFADFSRLLHKLVVAKAPKYLEDSAGWGATTPIPEKLRLPGLRVRVRVGDRDELPHGTWHKYRVTMMDPARDIVIDVRDFRQTAPRLFRLSLDAQASIQGELELLQWQKGLKLADIRARADATVATQMECDIAVTLKTQTFPPELVLDPKVTDCKLILRDFTLRDVTLARLGRALEGEQARQVGNDFKQYLQQGLTFVEPGAKAQLNDAIAESLRSGKGTLSAASLLRLFSAEKN